MYYFGIFEILLISNSIYTQTQILQDITDQSSFNSFIALRINLVELYFDTPRILSKNQGLSIRRFASGGTYLCELHN